jgi:replicative DNA helicase
MNPKNNTTNQIQMDGVPPQAIEAEEIVLGGLLLDSEAYSRIANILSNPDCFYKEDHRIVFKAIQKLAQSGKPTDPIMVGTELARTGELEAAGGRYGLTMLTKNIARATNIEHHARIVAQTFIQRELIRIGWETARSGFDNSLDIEEQLTNLRNKFTEIENIAISTHTGKTQIDVLSGSIQEIEEDCRRTESGKPAGITTGLKILNRNTGGWRDTNLVILAARPGVGKTSLALHFAIKAAQAGTWVNFYGLEMTSEDLMRIMIAAESGVDRTSLRDGKVSEEEWSRINKATTKLERLPILWYDNAGITSAQINANTRRNKKKGRCGLVIIDYLQLMTPTDKKANREQQVSEISRTLKKTALEMKVPILCLSQLNREASEGKPQLHHLRESGAIEQDADVVIFPWWDEEARYQITVAKNRRGTCGTFEIAANEQMTHFSDLDQSSVMPIIHNPNNRIEAQPF